jgi:hypothetical protein
VGVVSRQTMRRLGSTASRYPGFAAFVRGSHGQTQQQAAVRFVTMALFALPSIDVVRSKLPVLLDVDGFRPLVLKALKEDYLWLIPIQ